MISRRRFVPWNTLLPALVFLGTSLLLGSCRGEGSGSRETAHQAASDSVSSSAVKSSPPATGDLSLAAMCKRTATRFLEAELDGHRQRLARHGLVVPGPLPLAVALAPTTQDDPRRLLLAERVRDALVEEAIRLEGVTLRRDVETADLDTKLTVDVLNDFGAPLDTIVSEFHLELAEARKVHRDRFQTSQGLVSITSPELGPETKLVVSASQEGRFSQDFQVATGQWFLMPKGRYRSLTVRWNNGCWTPPSLVIGAQNFWNLSDWSNVPDVPLTSPPEDYAGTSPRPPETEGGHPQLIILSPGPNETVGRVIHVSGVAKALEGSQVRVVVTVNGESYPQAHEVTVFQQRWRMPRVVLGRVGDQDAGQSFDITAEACTNDGRVIRSQTVTAVRER